MGFLTPFHGQQRVCGILHGQRRVLAQGLINGIVHRCGVCQHGLRLGLGCQCSKHLVVACQRHAILRQLLGSLRRQTGSVHEQHSPIRGDVAVGHGIGGTLDIHCPQVQQPGQVIQLAHQLGRLRKALADQGCTAQLVGKLDNLAWLLNLRAMDIECTPYAMAYCYVTPDRAVLFMDASRLAPEAAQELAENGVTLAGYDQVLAALAAETEPQTVLADPASVNYAVYEALSQNPALTVKDAADPLLPMKGVKNPTELAHLRQAHIRDGVAMVRFQMELEQRLADGEQLSELTIDEILHKHRSAQDKFLTESFGTIAAYGPNAAMMHYHATEEDHAKLERRGFLLVDSGATYMDGTTDITRTYPLGELTQDERAFYTWTLQCHIDIAKAVWLDYCDGHMLDTLAREPLWQHLINYRCGTGHSVSFVGNVHEGPHALNGRNTTVFRPGMIVTDEPGVYEGGVVGIRIENELECVHKATNQYGTFLAFEPVTFVPIDTSPILPGVLNADQLAWLNEYHRQVYATLAPHLTEAERNWLAGKCAAIGC